MKVQRPGDWRPALLHGRQAGRHAGQVGGWVRGAAAWLGRWAARPVRPPLAAATRACLHGAQGRGVRRVAWDHGRRQLHLCRLLALPAAAAAAAAAVAAAAVAAAAACTAAAAVAGFFSQQLYQRALARCHRVRHVGGGGLHDARQQLSQYLVPRVCAALYWVDCCEGSGHSGDWRGCLRLRPPCTPPCPSAPRHPRCCPPTPPAPRLPPAIRPPGAHQTHSRGGRRRRTATTHKTSSHSLKGLNTAHQRGGWRPRTGSRAGAARAPPP